MVIHKWKVWVVRIAFLCGLLIISSTLQTEAATKNSWTVKVNNEYKAKLVKKKDQWYLQSTSIQMKNKKGTERIAYLSIPSNVGLICPLSSRQVKYLKVSDKNTYISFWSVGIFMHTISLYIF